MDDDYIELPPLEAIYRDDEPLQQPQPQQPQPRVDVDQSFIPPEWLSEEIATEGPYEDEPVYRDPVNNKIHKRPLSRAALRAIMSNPSMLDYGSMINHIPSSGFIPHNDYEAYIAGQALSLSVIEKQEKKNQELENAKARAYNREGAAETYKFQLEKAQQDLANLREYYADANNNPEILQTVNQLRQEKTDLQNQLNAAAAEVANRDAEIQRLNEELQYCYNEINVAIQYKNAVENGTIGSLYQEVNTMLEDRDRAHKTEINDINTEHKAVVLKLQNTIIDLRHQISELKVKTEDLRRKCNSKMDSYMHAIKVKEIDDSSKIEATKEDLLDFIDNVLEVYDMMNDGVADVGKAIASASKKVTQLTDGFVTIKGAFEDIYFPDLEEAVNQANEMRNKVKGINRVGKKRLDDFIKTGNLPKKVSLKDYIIPDADSGAESATESE